jgi:membrane-associated phospholipid phosphatase
MRFLTDFADLGLILPLTALVALSLAAVGRRRDALAWSLAVTGTLGAMMALKVSVFVLPGQAAPWSLNPSGHTAAGVVVYAGLLVLVGERFAPRVPIALLAGAAFGLLFGYTRVALRAHSLPDVLVGAAVGLAGALILARLAGPRRPDAPAYGHAVVAAIALLGVLTLHGHRLGAEAALRSVAAEVRSGGKP